jgi:hypothetical protein
MQQDSPDDSDTGFRKLPLLAQMAALVAGITFVSLLIAALYFRGVWNSTLDLTYDQTDTIAEGISRDLDGIWRDHIDVLNMLAVEPAVRALDPQICNIEGEIGVYDNLRTDISAILVRDATGLLVCSTLGGRLPSRARRVGPLLA